MHISLRNGDKSHANAASRRLNTVGVGARASAHNLALARYAVFVGDALKGGDGAHNAVALQAVLNGAENPYRDISLANAAASLMIAGRAKDLTEGMALARQSLSSGGAKTALQRLISVSNAA